MKSIMLYVRNTVLAKRVGTKADKLNSDAALHNLQVEDTVAFELQAGRETRDWSNEPGRETRCKLLAKFARDATGVQELDEGETIWQLNWVQPTEPSQDKNLKTTMEPGSGSQLHCATTQEQSCSTSQSKQF